MSPRGGRSVWVQRAASLPSRCRQHGPCQFCLYTALATAAAFIQSFLNGFTRSSLLRAVRRRAPEICCASCKHHRLCYTGARLNTGSTSFLNGTDVLHFRGCQRSEQSHKVENHSSIGNFVLGSFLGFSILQHVFNFLW